MSTTTLYVVAPLTCFLSGIPNHGYRAIVEKHPLLIPAIAGFCALVIVGIIIWRRTPGKTASILALTERGIADHSLGSEVLRTYGFPMVMFALAIIAVLNWTYSGHGGPSWLLLSLCFPWVIVRILFKVATGSETSSGWYKAFFKVTVPAYIVLSIPLSWAAATSISMTFGWTVSTWSFFALIASPFQWWYFT